MAMYGQRASELVQELARCDKDRILRHNNDLFTRALDETHEHYQLLETALMNMREDGEDGQTSQNADYVGGFIHHSSILRNKRCLLAYVYNRAERIRRLRWELGAVLPQDIQDNFSNSEKEYFKDYSLLLGAHMSKIDLDLTVDATPPKDPLVQVRVLENIGEVLLGNQQVVLSKSSFHFLARTDAEPLILQGLLEEVEG